MPKLNQSFYIRQDVVQISKELLGTYLYSKINGVITGGMIVETEAYAGVEDKASHAYGGRFTERTKTMYKIGGTAYVYLCYGIHALFNVVTNDLNVPHAILIRGIKPTVGIETILKRRQKSKLTNDLCIGPGKVSQALGITTNHTGISLLGNEIWLEHREIETSDKISISKRIGIDYAGEDANLPYRFVLNI